MATQNLFEKYGIKEVADVTFYRIERKTETYESQREISVASILKGAIETKTVYPMDNDGLGMDEGFEAYVFTDANVLTGANYACDNDTHKTATITVTLSDYAGPETMKISQMLIAGATISGDLTSMPVNASYTDISVQGEQDGTIADAYDYTAEIEIEYNENGAPIHTHEYAYVEQILMLFAKKQNLIKKTGVRYSFTDTDIFGTLVFDDNFAETPNSSEKVVVLGIDGNFDIGSYVVDDVTAAIQELASKTYKAKAYDITYKDYAELIVDDEMGYFNPQQISATITLDTDYVAEKVNKGEIDTIIANAEMWGDGVHYSVNDAIMALRQKKASLDQGDVGVSSILQNVDGGYLVGDEITRGATDEGGLYTTPQTNSYALTAVLEALASITDKETISFVDNGTPSNRAIYVNVDNVDTAASAYIYILQNTNKRLATDVDGIFKFTDRVGNTVFYKDAIFAGVEYLALVVIGTKGLIFKVDRHGTAKTEQIAWMMNENGYITDKQAEKIVSNGLIHTIDIDKNDETFEATCSVSGIKVRKIQKTVNRYVPVLFLDTLKVSTIEQTAEQTAATGGKGNAQLIVWDYGKEITLTLEDALYSPASMSAMLGSYEGNDFTKGVKETKRIDRTEKCIAKRSFIVPAGNSKGVPSEGETTAQAVYIDPNTMQPYQDGTPIAEGEMFLKWTRSVAYGDNSLGSTIEISADKFPGTYKVVGDTFARNKTTGEDQRFQFVVPQAKMTSEQTITLEAEGDPTVFNLNLTVLRPDDGIMVKLIQYDVVENEEENDGSTMVKGTENLNLLDDAEMFKVSSVADDDETYIGATEY